MVDVAGNVGGAVSPVLQLAEWLAAPICRQFKYLYNYTTNFKNLEMEVGKLKNSRDEVKRKIIAAERNVQEIKQNVKNWQKDVEKTIIEAEQLIQEKANNPRCFKGLCPNFIIHYKQSKKAFKLKRDDIAPLLQQEKDLDPVSDPTNPPEIWLRSSENYLAFESRNSTVKNVWDALNDENVFMIGVYGMGGLGKTTLVQEVGRKAEKEKLFDDIVFVEVSESPDIKKIQTVIADNLGLKFENETERAKKLYSRMEGKNILLILDNIWEPLEFENTIGIPCGVGCGRNKLLFTSRNLDVLEKMGSTNNFGLGILNENEAWNLFTKMAGDVIQTHRLHSLPNDVCKECRGLPIVICTIGKALKNKSDLSDWKVALQELKAPSPTNFIGLLEKEYMKIALSYKYLRNDELKKTFLIASLLENNTSTSDLFKHVVCLDILEGANLTMENARHRLDTLVRELKDACLLLDGLKSKQFAMHDVIRVVALTIAYVDHHVFTARNDIERDWKDRDKFKKCTKISLLDNSTIISQLWPNDLECPNLEYVYMTNMWNSSFEIPNDFFTMMPKLKVLNLVYLQQSLLPSSIDLLANLQTLCLDYSNVEDVVVVGKLKKLKVLSLRGSNIKEFPTELTQLRLLDLNYCRQLKVIAPNVISKLSHLEELYLKGCPIQWKIELLEELKLLFSLNSLELNIKDDKVLPKDFFSRELIRYNISVGNLSFPYSKIGEQECLTILKLICNSTIYLEELCEIKNVELLCLAESLDDHKHSKFNLQSNEITPLFNKKVIFSDLKVLVLKNIISRKIWDNQLPSSSFQNLKELILWGCTKIKFVFSYTTTKNFQQLQYLEIKDCIDLEEIVAIEEITEAVASVVFPEVTFLELENLPEFATFYPGIHTLEWPKLKRLEMKNCNKFGMFNSEPNSLCLDYKINHDLEMYQVKDGLEEIRWWSQSKHLIISYYKSTPIPLWLFQRFQNLTCLFVNVCHELVNLTTLSTARSLVQLRELEISNCQMLMEILEIEEDATTEIVFENLNKLLFRRMENLTCFCSGNCTFNFRSLEELNIAKCPNIKTFCRGILSTPKLQKISYEEMKVENEGNDLNKTIQELYKKEKQDISLDLNLKCKAFHQDNSMEIVYNQHLTSFYQNLTHLFLWKCGNIKYAIPSSIAKILHQLQQLKIQNCKALEEIVAKEDGANAVVDFVFPNITLLKFEDLPKLTAFYPGLYALEIPKLKELVVNYCTKYASLKENNVETELNILAPKSIFLDNKINHDLEEFQLKDGWERISWWSQSKKLEISDYKSVPILLWLLQRFENLTCLFVYGCHELVNLTTLSTARSLVQLRELKISHCYMLMEILETEEDATTEIVFENLNKLSFDRMKSLMCFCSRNYTFNFPSLEELNIANCPNMMTFCRGILSTSKLQKISYEKMEVENDGNDLNKTIQGLYKKKNQDISLDLNFKCKAFHHDNSMEIAYNQHPTSFYQNLTYLFLWKCGNIKYAFPSSIARSLHQLQQLKIQNCKVLKEIVAKEEGANAVVDFIFPNITLLKVEDLPELTAFYPGIYTLEMPKLKELVVKDCTKYASLKENNMETELNILAPKSIFLDNKINFNLKVFDGKTNIGWLSQSKALTIDDISVTISLRLLQRFENVRELQLSSSQYKDIKSLCDLPNLEILEVHYCYRLMSLVPFSGSFQNLKVLKVRSCNRLIMKLITVLVAKSLTQLRELSISYCDMLTEIVDNEGDATSTEIVFNSLNKLSLESLESLICFCSGNYSFNFPSLEELIIKDCPNLEIFCQGHLCTPNLDKVIYKFEDRVVKLEEVENVREVEIGDNDLNTTIQQEYKKKVGSSWEELTLSGRNIMTTLQGEFQENFDKVKTLRLIKDDHEYIEIHILEKFINLKKLILTVSLYEEIFSCEEGEEHVGALSKLEDLQLQGLFNLKCSWKQDFQFKSILQNLHSLNVKHCHNLMTLLPSSSSFKNLMTLEVKYCSGMQNLMTFSTAKSLVCLKTLSIEECEMMIEVLANEGDIEKDEVVFERLKKLRLYNLESLTWFYYGNYTLKFPFLESLIVAKCSKMKTFSREGVNMPRLQQVNFRNCSDDLSYVTTQLQNDCSKLWEKFP